MRVRSIPALAMALILVFGPAGAALAKSSGSFSSGGSRSSSSGWSSSTRPSSPAPSSSGSSGWSSGSKPSQSAPSSSAPAQSSSTPGGWSNTGGASSSQQARPAGTSAFSSSGADSVRKQAATSSYQGYQGLYSKSGNPAPGQVGTGKPILNPTRTFGSYQEYNGYRDNYYAGRGWSAPTYVFHSYPSFGMWDAMFMWFMLSHLSSGPGFFYNHQNDPGVQAFQQEAQKLSASNEDLKKQLNEMNAKLDDMKKSGVAPDPNYVPKDVDPNVALAQPKIEPKQEEPKSAASSLFWPIVGLVGAGGLGYLLLFRRRV